MKQKYNWHSYLVASILLGLFFFVGAATQVKAIQAYGVTAEGLFVRFDTDAPNIVTVVRTSVGGLQSGERILGIDFRPANGQLYAVSSLSRIYTINITTGVATPVGFLSVPLNSATNVGFDFNPTVDRIRIVTDNEQNLRVNPNDGSSVNDGTLAFATGDTNAGRNPNIVGSAYTNSFAGAVSTALYGIDSNLDILVRQDPANDGRLLTVGPLGFNTTERVGFDIDARTGTAFATLTVGTSPALVSISLSTGTATFRGNIDANITSFALVPSTVVQVPNFSGYALTLNQQLIQFNSTNPNVGVRTVPITGLLAGQTLRGIDFRPATGQLFGFGSTGTIGSLYTINPRTGVATFIGNVNADSTGNDFGFDFNPTVDRIRIVNEQEKNLRVNPNDATVTQDGTLVYAAGDPNFGRDPYITAAAYTNSFQGATTTALYDIDANQDTLVQQDPANAGTLRTVGNLGFDITRYAGFDIASGNRGFVALQANGSTNSGFYTINLMTGALGFVGTFGTSSPVISLAFVSGATATNRLDFDGDARADYALFRPSTGQYLIRNSANGTTRTVTFGQASTDIQTPGDYDGDGLTDIAVYRRDNSTFYVLRSSDNTGNELQVQFGQRGDEPVARDYDGDGRTDFAVVRRTGGNLVWFIMNSTNGNVRQEQFGLASDFVAPGDYDGDGRFDLAVYRGDSNGLGFFIYKESSTGNVKTVRFGLASDLVVPGDYDGDGKTDFALVREGNPFTWFILRSSDLGVTIIQFGQKPQFEVQNDYDGDGRTDIATYDPRTSQFFVLRSTGRSTDADGGITTVNFGQSGDYPIANYDVH